MTERRDIVERGVKQVLVNGAWWVLDAPPLWVDLRTAELEYVSTCHQVHHGLNVFLTRTHARADTHLPIDEPSEAPGHTLLFALDASLQIALPGVKRTQTVTPAKGLWFVPERSAADFHYPKGCQTRELAITFSEELLPDVSGASSGALRNLINGGKRPREPMALGVGVQSALLRVGSALFGAPLVAPAQRLFVEAAALEIIARSIDALAQHDKRSTDCGASALERRRVEEARDRMIADLRAPPAVGELARAVGLSRRRLSSCFREVFGESLVGYLTRYKLDVARELLENEEIPVKEIAWRLGYQHVNNFTNAFTARFGVPPARFRRSLKNHGG